MAEILTEVAAERVRQDLKWGGPEHDDTHTHADWINLIDKRLAPPASHRTPAVEYRRAMIKIAALAIAAVASFDRKKGRSNP